MNDVSSVNAPMPSTADIQALIAAELSAPPRTRYTLLLLASFMSSVTAAFLLLTETALPRRTLVALALVLAIGLSWTVFAGWVLMRRRVLFARHHVVSARMGVVFTTLYTVGALAVGRSTLPGGFWLMAAALGVLMLGAAIGLLVRAQRRAAALERRRLELENQLGTRSSR